MLKPLACLFCLAVLAACAAPRGGPILPSSDARSGAVGVQDISGLLQAPEGRVALAPNEAYLEPLEAVGSPLPGYPPALLDAQLAPQTVCVSVAIGADGAILSSRGRVDLPTCPEPVHPAFVNAARTTLATWVFEPARRCVFPSPAAKALANANCSGGREIPIAVTLTYRFVFEQHDGRGSVRRSL